MRSTLITCFPRPGVILTAFDSAVSSQSTRTLGLGARLESRLGSKAREHKACIVQRTTKDDGEDEFEPEFSMQYPNPFSQHWYNRAEVETRLHAARHEKQRTQAQGEEGCS